MSISRRLLSVSDPDPGGYNNNTYLETGPATAYVGEEENAPAFPAHQGVQNIF